MIPSVGSTQPSNIGHESRSNEQLNLAVLQRHEPEVSAILSIAPYAVLYTFTPTSAKWEKVGIEGTLFVCGLQSSETARNRFAVFILNRRGLDNFFLELESSESVEVTTEYVIVQAETQDMPEVYGIWIYQEPEPSSTAGLRERNAKLIEHCARLAGLSREMGTDVIEAARGEGTNGQSVGGPKRSNPAEDATMSEKVHATPVASSMPQFQPSADTQFFLSGRRDGVQG